MVIHGVTPEGVARARVALEAGRHVLLLTPDTAGSLAELGVAATVEPSSAKTGIISQHYAYAHPEHPACRGFADGDFAYWFDADRDRGRCLANHVIVTKDPSVRPVLSSGGHFLCAQFTCGRGVLTVCTLSLAGRATHPVCTRFMAALASARAT